MALLVSRMSRLPANRTMVFPLERVSKLLLHKRSCIVKFTLLNFARENIYLRAFFHILRNHDRYVRHVRKEQEEISRSGEKKSLSGRPNDRRGGRETQGEYYLDVICNIWCAATSRRVHPRARRRKKKKKKRGKEKCAPIEFIIMHLCRSKLILGSPGRSSPTWRAAWFKTVQGIPWWNPAIGFVVVVVISFSAYFPPLRPYRIR